MQQNKDEVVIYVINIESYFFYIIAKKFKMKRGILSIILAIIIFAPSIAQKDGEVKWYSVEDVDQLLKEDPKPIFIDAYTDWCGWCKRLDADTFSNPIIAKYLNDNFYPVKFDAESSKPVTFLGNEFINDGKAGKAHQLAVALMQGRMGYPTVIFMNEKGELLAPVPGYKQPQELEPYLVFFAEKRYVSENWEAFQKSFKGSF